MESTPAARSRRSTTPPAVSVREEQCSKASTRPPFSVSAAIRSPLEVHVANGLPAFGVVGLPDASCREARDRVRAALVSSGLTWPSQRITVNLAPPEFSRPEPSWTWQWRSASSWPVANSNQRPSTVWHFSANWGSTGRPGPLPEPTTWCRSPGRSMAFLLAELATPVACPRGSEPG
ncbi:MAG: hypothetical protein CL505_04560 [Actinobacteria bacterium]|nr:hypothetical protein [Actinomycetota bacterium]